MENKNLHKQMAELMNGLTGEQKEKAKNCKSVDELASLMSEFGVALPDELLDTVAGGGNQEELDFIFKLAKWDDVCQQRGIGVYDAARRDQVWSELFPLG